MEYRNIFEFPARRLFRRIRRSRRRRSILGGGVGVSVSVVGIVGVLALGDGGPLVKEEMGTVITVRMVTVSVIVGAVGIGGSRGGGNVDPFLLPLPHRSSEHRGRSVPGR